MSAALVVPQPSPPTVTCEHGTRVGFVCNTCAVRDRSDLPVLRGTCVLTVPQALPCPECHKGMVPSTPGMPMDGFDRCEFCNGDGLAPPGTPIVVVVKQRDGGPVVPIRRGDFPIGVPRRTIPAAVTLVGKLAEQVQRNATSGAYLGHVVTLVDVRVLPDPLTEWVERDQLLYDRQSVEHKRGHNEWITHPVPVSSLPDTVSICSPALWAAIEEAS